jgi:sorbitol-specific phosphotransferase system component IIA
MSGLPDLAMRRAEGADAKTLGHLLHDFDGEFEEPTPGPRVVADRVREVLSGGQITILLGGNEQA